MTRTSSMLLSGVCLFTTLLACGTSVDGPEPVGLAPQEKQALSDDPLVVPPDTLLPTERKPNGAAAGQMDATFKVSEDGEATYSIPLWVPAGRAGLQPSLSIGYNSRAGNGPLGVGWRLSGFSEITRCRKTFIQDGATAPITFLPEDAFCMDGRRLVPVATSGSTTEYRTETEVFTKVVAHRDSSGAPDYFEAFLKDGRIFLYGSRADSHSRLEGFRQAFTADPVSGAVTASVEPTAVRLGWALSEARDRAGNDLRITYLLEGSPSEGYERLPSRIDYTGHVSDTAGLLRRRSVTFVYQSGSRPDGEIRYVSGLKLRSTRRLQRIEMRGPGLGSTPTTRDDLLVRAYDLTYRNDTLTHRSLLHRVFECDGQGVCRDPLEFDYDTGFDCDANPDNDCSDPIVQARDFTAITAVENQGGSLVPIRDLRYGANVPPTLPIAGVQDFWTLHTMDINGDGRDDLLYRRNDQAQTVSTPQGPMPSPGEGTWYYRLSQGSSGLFGPATLAGLPKSKTGNSDDDLRIADMDGDGVAEVIAFQAPDASTGQDGYFQLYRFNGTTFQAANISAYEITQFWWQTSNPATEAGRFPVMHLADLNGDGLPELFRSTKQPQPFSWGFRMNQGALNLSPYTQVPLRSGLDHSGYTVDVDGDGSTEVLVRTADTRGLDNYSAQYHAVSVGSGTTHRTWPTTLSAAPVASSPSLNWRWHYNRSWFVDVNGDGLADAVSVRRDRDTETQGRLYGDLLIAINTGNGFAPPVFQNLDELLEISPSWINQTQRGLDPGVRVMDFDHDGRQDLLLTDSGVTSGRGVLRETQWVLLGRDDHFEPRQLTVPVGQSTGGISASKPFGYGQRLTQVLDINGDGFLDIAQVEDDPSAPAGQKDLSGILRLYVRRGRLPDVLTTVRPGRQGKGVRVRYQHLMEQPTATGQPLIYTRGTCAYPQQCVTKGPWVVVEAGVDDGKGSSTFNTAFYSYEAGRVDLQGRGWLGYARRTVLDKLTGTKTTLTYDNQTRDGTLYLRAGHPLTETTELTLANGIKHSSTRTSVYTVATSAASRPFLYASQVTEDLREGLGTSLPLIRRSIRTQAVDTYGNVTDVQQVEAEVTSGNPTGRVWRERTNVPEITNDATNWLIGQRRRVEESSTAYDGTVKTRTTTLEYDPATGLLKKTVGQPAGGADVELTTVLGRDAFGLVERVERTGSGTTRVETSQYDTLEHQFPSVVFNAAGHRTRSAMHPALGVVAVAEDANGLVARFRYDGFGRERAALPPTGADTTTQYGADAFGWMKVTTTVAGGQQTSSTLDNYGREIRQELRGFDGGVIFMTTDYDFLGRKTRVSRPAPVSGVAPLQYTLLSYDLLNRLTEVMHPEGTSTRYTYDQLSTTLFDERNNKSVAVTDGRNQLVASSQYTSDNRELRTTYTYGPFGLLRQVKDPQNNVIQIEHDVLGRRTKVTDPDSGVTQTAYNAFGEPRWEKDGAGRETTYDEYDGLGRKKKMTSLDGVTTYVWDTTWKGALANATSPDGVTTSYLYSAKGQLAESTWTRGTDSYSINQTYDTFGRPETLTYPDVLGRRLRLRQGYTAYGDLKDVRDDVTQHVFWTAQGRNAFGQLTSESFGNGVTSQRRYDPRGRLRFIDSRKGATVLQGLAYEWDAEGNLLSRSDVPARTTEDFQYDTLDRLTRWTVFQNCRRSALEYRYDDLGNLLERRVLEGSGTATTGTYTGSGAGPHAVKQTQAGSYGYAGNGNQISAPGRTVQYTAFDLPARIAGSGREVNYKYDANQSRFLKTNSLGEVTTYVGGLYEKRQAGGQTRHVFYIPGAERVVSQVVWTEGAGTIASEAPLYLLADHLGSTETVTDIAGASLASDRMKFEPFGARRMPHALTVAASVPSGLVRKGFTGHESDDEFGLVNMGGRIYDPETTRFLTPDPLVQLPHDGQSYNRYAYVLNNPLRWTDPTGFEGEGGEPSFDFGFEETIDVIGEWLNEEPGPQDATPIANWGGPIVLSADQNGTASAEALLKSNAIQQRGNLANIRANGEYIATHGLNEQYWTEHDRQMAQFRMVCRGAGIIIFEGVKFVVLDLVTRKVGRVALGALEAAIIDGAVAMEVRAVTVSGTTRYIALEVGCFVAGTPVLAQSGSVPIEQVAAGDWVWSWDAETKEPGWHRVTRTFVRPDRAVVRLALVSADGRTEELGTTQEHPFWVEGRGWVEARHLEPGDAVTTATGIPAWVRSLQMSAEVATVYNFEVEQAHTYFVGTLAAWVHNNNPCMGAATTSAAQLAAAASKDPGLAAFVARLEKAGIKVNGVNISMVENGKVVGEIDVVTQNALIQYKNGASSAAAIIDQVKNKTEPFVSMPVVTFVEDVGKAGMRTVKNASPHVLVTNDFDTLIQVIR